jgi:hypothetical protein
MQDPYAKLKVIRFEGEMLPNWAQLLDAAARLCHVAEETRRWFSRLTHSSGVDDSRTVVVHSKRLVNALRENKPAIVAELERKQGESQASKIFAAWEYALDTMIQAAASKKTCSWQIEGMEDTGDGDLGGGDITLRRV